MQPNEYGPPWRAEAMVKLYWRFGGLIGQLLVGLYGLLPQQWVRLR